MIVRINKNIFNNVDDTRCVAIKFLLCIAMYKDRYQLMIKTPLSVPVEKKLGSHDADLFRYIYINSINTKQYDCEISDDGYKYDEKSIFTIDEGIRYLLQPISVILENNKNDGKFINEMVRVYKHASLSKALLEHWLCYVNAGGCSNIKNIVDAMLSSYDNRKKFLRCYVILDSDKHAANHQNPNTVKYDAQLKASGIPYHIWEKRMMENYIPDDAIPDSKWKKAYLSLSGEQKDFYCISEGFSKDEVYEEHGIKKPEEAVGKDLLIPCEKHFFENVIGENYMILRNGMPGYSKLTYPDLYKDPNAVNKNSMATKFPGVNGPNEIECVLDEISRLL